MAKVEWLKERKASPYGVTVPGTQTEVSFMVKDSKRFPETNGWGYATFTYERRLTRSSPRTTNAAFALGRPLGGYRWCAGPRLRLHQLREAVSAHGFPWQS